MRAILSLFSVIVLFAACSDNNQEVNQIETLEKELAETSSKDPKKADELIAAYEKFADENTKDSLAPEYLFKAGSMKVALGRFEEAIKSFDKLYTQYPDSKRAPESLFFQADIYRANMMNPEMARKKFSEFVNKYPNHNMVRDAKLLIQDAGKNDEELFQEVLKRNQAIKDSLKVSK